MTREEAIEWLGRIKDRYIHGGDEGFDNKRKEAIDMAIEALQQLTSYEGTIVKLTNAISRPQGEWEKDRLPSSECKSQFPIEQTNYCPNCGAKMDK